MELLVLNTDFESIAVIDTYEFVWRFRDILRYGYTTLAVFERGLLSLAEGFGALYDY